MSFHLLEAVYHLERRFTSASEQAVLAALAHRKNPVTGKCCPSQKMLIMMTHLVRSTISDALNELREHNYISWTRGGRQGIGARKDLPNDYTINEQLIFSQSTYKPPAKKKDVPDDQTSMSGSRTQDCPPAGHKTVRQPDTSVSASRTQTEIETENQQNRNRKVTEAVFNSTLKHVGVDGLPKPSEVEWEAKVKTSPLYLALDLCGLRPGMPEYIKNCRIFAKKMIPFALADNWEIIKRIESRKRQGELDDIRDWPAFITSEYEKAAQH